MGSSLASLECWPGAGSITSGAEEVEDFWPGV
jgi:hypothetical protein